MDGEEQAVSIQLITDSKGSDGCPYTQIEMDGGRPNILRKQQHPNALLAQIRLLSLSSN